MARANDLGRGRSPTPPWHIGVDVGATFTDLALIDASGRLFTHKTLSIPDDPTRGVIDNREHSAAAFGLVPEAMIGGGRLFVHGDMSRWLCHGNLDASINVSSVTSRYAAATAAFH